MTNLFVAVRALFFATCFWVFWGWVAFAVERYDARLPALVPPWLAAPGLLVMAAGAALVATCIALFARVGRGTPAPFDAPRRFVAVGPYRYVRNPMYVGGFTLLLGWALYRNSISLLLFSCAFVLFFHLFVVGYEEPTLRDRFGAEYERYLASVPRWIPRPR
jgi:protein-S-isoprenylcysteine O-methyltransferase Ste14